MTGCLPECPARHQQFEIDAGDRAKKTYEDALALALRRAPERGRQTVHRHVGTFLSRGCWFVQDARAPDVAQGRPRWVWVRCSRCGKRVSNVVPGGEMVVRAWVECPECVKKDAPEPVAAPSWADGVDDDD